jgi:hypothetical protein
MLKPAIGGRVLDPALAAVLHIARRVVLVNAGLAIMLQAAIELRVANGTAMAWRG